MTNTETIKVGDKVTKGKGKTVWTVLRVGVAACQVTSGKQTTMFYLHELRLVK